LGVRLFQDETKTRLGRDGEAAITRAARFSPPELGGGLEIAGTVRA
jgi:hypothetical protein